MAVTVTHATVTAVPDDPAYDIGSDEWNAAHKGAEPVYNVMDYGAACDGSTDDSAAVIAAIAACQAASGGVVYFPAMTRCDSQIVIPNDGDTPVPHQKAMIFRGCGSHFKGIASAVSGGSGLDLRYAGTVGKIVTLGLGSLTIEDMTFINGHNDSLPFIHTTNTTLLVRNNGFVGYATGGTLSDAIVLGGQAATAGGSSSDYFQGYGTAIDNNYFNYINRGVLLQRNANAIVIRGNTWWADCAGSAAIEDWNSSSNGIQGLFTAGNLIEMNGYTYGICMNYAARGVHLADNFYDASGTFTSYYRFADATAIPNCVIPGFYASATAAKLGSGSGYPCYLTQTAVGKFSLLDNTGSYTNSALLSGRLELFGNRFVSRSPNNDEVFNIYSTNGHVGVFSPTQSDGFMAFQDYGGNNVLVLNANDGTWKLQNAKSGGYTYWETKGGDTQGTIPLGRWKDYGGTTGTTVNSDGTLQVNLYQELVETTAPSAPAANTVRIYAEDNGAGKTRLMAKFNTGAAQQIAIEP